METTTSYTPLPPSPTPSIATTTTTTESTTRRSALIDEYCRSDTPAGLLSHRSRLLRQIEELETSIASARSRLPHHSPSTEPEPDGLIYKVRTHFNSSGLHIKGYDCRQTIPPKLVTSLNIDSQTTLSRKFDHADVSEFYTPEFPVRCEAVDGVADHQEATTEVKNAARRLKELLNGLFLRSDDYRIVLKSVKGYIESHVGTPPKEFWLITETSLCVQSRSNLPIKVFFEKMPLELFRYFCRYLEANYDEATAIPLMGMTLKLLACRFKLETKNEYFDKEYCTANCDHSEEQQLECENLHFCHLCHSIPKVRSLVPCADYAGLKREEPSGVLMPVCWRHFENPVAGRIPAVYQSQTYYNLISAAAKDTAARAESFDPIAYKSQLAEMQVVDSYSFAEVKPSVTWETVVDLFGATLPASGDCIAPCLTFPSDPSISSLYSPSNLVRHSKLGNVAITSSFTNLLKLTDSVQLMHLRQIGIALNCVVCAVGMSGDLKAIASRALDALEGPKRYIWSAQRHLGMNKKRTSAGLKSLEFLVALRVLDLELAKVIDVQGIKNDVGTEAYFTRNFPHLMQGITSSEIQRGATQYVDVSNIIVLNQHRYGTAVRFSAEDMQVVNQFCESLNYTFLRTEDEESWPIPISNAEVAHFKDQNRPVIWSDIARLIAYRLDLWINYCDYRWFHGTGFSNQLTLLDVYLVLLKTQAVTGHRDVLQGAPIYLLSLSPNSGGYGHIKRSSDMVGLDLTRNQGGLAMFRQECPATADDIDLEASNVEARIWNSRQALKCFKGVMGSDAQISETINQNIIPIRDALSCGIFNLNFISADDASKLSAAMGQLLSDKAEQAAILERYQIYQDEAVAPLDVTAASSLTPGKRPRANSGTTDNES